MFLSFLTSTKFRIGIFVTLILMLIALGWLYRAEIKKAASQAQTIAHQLNTLKDLEKRVSEIEEERERLLELVEKHTDETQKIRTENQKLRKSIEELKENDKEVLDWSNDTVPSSITDVLRGKEADSSKD